MEYIYFPTSGVVSTTAVSESGDSVEICMSGSEGLVGTSALLGQSEFAHGIAMQIAGQGYRVGVPVARTLLSQNGVFTKLVYEHIALQMLQMGQSALCNRLHEVKARLARWLLAAADRNQDEQLRLTQEFLGQMLGARRSTVTVMAGELQRDGMIEYSRGKIRITNRDALEATSCTCYGTLKKAYQRALLGEKESL